MARYVFKSTRNYTTGFDWITTSFDLDYVQFRFIIPSRSGFFRTAWMTAEKAYKYISFGGLLYQFVDSMIFTKRIEISD